jgi:acetyl-CoA acyltransferase 1
MSSSRDHDVVIVAAVRTPLCRSGSKGGALSQVPPSTLLSTVLESVLERVALPPSDVQDVCVGNVLLPPAGFGALRMAQLNCMPPSVPIVTVNRQCASGLQAISIIAGRLAAGQINVGLAAGVESMSQYPMSTIRPLPVDIKESLTVEQRSHVMDCLLPMGITSDAVAIDYQLSRTDLDQFALQSHLKAAAAQREGKFHSQIVPVTLKNGDTVTRDDGIRADGTLDKLSALRPVFLPSGGLTTAGNASQTTDGAAAVLLMTRVEAQRRGLTVQAVWRGMACAGVPPRVMGIGPVYAIPAVVAQYNQQASVPLSLSDVDVIELNEAFASQAVYCLQALNLPDGVLTPDTTNQINPNGGAIALGHPLGCTGARLVVDLLPELHRRQLRKRCFGLLSMCIGTGMGMAALIEVEPGTAVETDGAATIRSSL